MSPQSSARQFTDQSAILSGICLYEAMSKSGLTQGQLAERSGIDRSRISKFINSREAPRLDTLLCLLAACGYMIDILPVKEIVRSTPQGDCNSVKSK